MNKLTVFAIATLVFSVSAWGAGYTAENKDRIQRQRVEIRKRIEADMRQGYRFFTLEQYLENSNHLPIGSKVAVAGHYRDRNSISNQTGSEHVYVLTDNATSNSKAELLQCLKTVASMNTPCPTMVLGRISTCSIRTYDYPDGKVSCIDVRNTWMLFDIDQVWSMDEVWTLSPLNEEILAMQTRKSDKQAQ